MTTIPPRSWFLAILFLGVTGMSVLVPSPLSYLPFLLTLLLGGVLFLSRDRPDRFFYVACAAQPLIIACGLVNIWAGLFAVWMTGGMVAGMLDRLSSRQDLLFLLLFFGITLVLAGLVQLANHVLPLLVVLGAGLALALVVLILRDYQFRQHCAGAPP